MRSPWDNEPTPVRVVVEPRGEIITASIRRLGRKGLDGMATIWESLINAVICKQAKDAGRLGPKGKWSGTGTRSIPVVDTVTTGGKAGPKPSLASTRNVVSP